MTAIEESPKVRVLDEVINLLALSRQSRDLDEASFALEMEREMVSRRDQVIEELQHPKAA